MVASFFLMDFGGANNERWWAPVTRDCHEDSAAYDRLGVGYQYVRRPDPCLGGTIEEALGDAETILNVGA
jgi:hypothetical protein